MSDDEKQKPEEAEKGPSKAPAAPKAKPRRVTVEMSADVQAVYSNATLIDFSPAEVVIDFIQMLPRMPKAQVKTRVLLSPIHAKMLQQALSQHVKKFEQQFGEIRLPSQSILADQFFRFPKNDDDKDKGG